MISMNFSKREKYIFAAAVIFIAAALANNFIFEPCVKKWRALNSEIAAKKAGILKCVRLMEKRDSIIQEYNRYAGASKNISMILSGIEDKADSIGIRTGNIKLGQAIEREYYKEYAIELQIEGEMADIIEFLSDLVKLPTLAALKKLDFKLISQNPRIFKGTIILSKIII